MTHWVEKNLNLTKICNQIGGTKLWPKFLGQDDSIFLLRAPREKMSHLDLKNWITGGTKIGPNFLSQNDSIFSLVHQEKKWVILT